MRGALVIPCFNFERGIRSTIAQVVEWHVRQTLPVSVYFVDDGSSDKTGEILRSSCHSYSPWCHVLTHPANRGKGAAVRTGFEAARHDSDFVVFTDCDLNYGLDVISEKVIPSLSDNDVVILDRSWSEEARYHAFFRHLASSVYNRLVSILTGVNYRDTQAGLKGIQTRNGAELFRLMTLEGFAFDVELLSIANYYRLRVLQIPVQFGTVHVPPAHSTVNLLLTPWKMMLALLKINWNWRTARYRSSLLEERIDKEIYMIRQKTLKSAD